MELPLLPGRPSRGGLPAPADAQPAAPRGGGPLKELPERYFARRRIREAILFAESGGIAVHRNLDSYDGTLSPRGVRMTTPFLHVIGLRPLLAEWGRRHGLRPEWIQPEKRRRVAHYDVFGDFAEALIERLAPLSDASGQDGDRRPGGPPGSGCPASFSLS